MSGPPSAPPNWFWRKGGTNGVWAKKLRESSALLRRNSNSDAVQRVGSGLRHHADLRAGALAVFGAVGVGEDVEFAHGVDAQQFAADAAGRDGELARSGVFDAVQQDQIVHRAAGPSTENVLPLLVLVLALFRP